MALIEIQVTGPRIQVRAWPILVAHVDLTPRPPQHSTSRDVVAADRAHFVEMPRELQPIRTWLRHQVDHSITAISMRWLPHVQFQQAVH